MAASQPRVRRRRRPRRGSLERPVNGRLYRASFALVLAPILLLAFTVARPAPLARPSLPLSFDTDAALSVAGSLAHEYPDRTPGRESAEVWRQWFEQQLGKVPLTVHTWVADVPGLGRVPLTNLEAITEGQSPAAIIVMAHRDDLGTGPGANDNASGTATLIELARSYGPPPIGAQTHVQSAHRIVFLSTDGGAFGGLGAEHFIKTYGHPILAVINIDAIAGAGTPGVEITGDRPRSPNATLVATAVARIAEQTGAPPRHIGLLGQLIDLGFPYTLYEQGPFVAAGIPAVTLTTGGDRPPPAYTDRTQTLDQQRLGRLGAAAQALLASLNQDLALPPSTSSYVWLGGRIVRGWAIELVLVALLLPFAVAIVDLYALCRRQRLALGPAVRALRNRLGFWVFAGIVFTCFDLLGAWPGGPPRAPNPAAAVSGNWPVLALIALGLVVTGGWLVGHRPLVPRRPVTAEEQLAGYTVGLIALLLVALLLVAVNPFALLFVLPPLHLWLWLPQIRIARAPVRVALFAIGLVGPGLVLGSLAWRFGLGFDAPWYLLELVAVGYVKTPSVAIVLAGTAAAAQLAATASGRYAPYPSGADRDPRGPIRELVRTIVLTVRGRRRSAPYRAR